MELRDKTLDEKIKWPINLWSKTVIADEEDWGSIINSLKKNVLIPLAKEAFEAGVELGDNNLNITYLSSDEWIKEKFKV